ncbi:MAG: mandelate racemase [Actinobacteria bacterium]|nr:mandelate racemase [Actinomycetota bacterium]
MVLVEASGGGCVGYGWSYTHTAAAMLVDELLAPLVVGQPIADVAAAWSRMAAALRNLGRSGLGTYALSAVDVALWDLKARALALPLVGLLGRCADAVDAYGSGGFTSYTVGRLGDQLAGWAADGLSAVKMKVGREPEADIARVAVARDAIGPDVGLYVDANGAYDVAQAAGLADAFAEHGVSWFEEPVSSDDLDGLAHLRRRVPPGMAVAAGEYGDGPAYFRRMLAAGAVDVVQADATRCGGVTGFLRAAAVADAAGVPLSAHTAPTLHAPLCCAVPGARDVEWFHDHVRLERLVFEGTLEPIGGRLVPDMERVGLGVELKTSDADKYVTWASA